MSERMNETRTLADLIDDLRRDPPNAAVADKKGKFPMAALKRSPDGATLDMVPLTHAFTAENFQRLQALIAALWRDRALVLAAPALLAALIDLLACNEAEEGTPQNFIGAMERARAAIAKAEGRA